jgi:hypothetical protein
MKVICVVQGVNHGTSRQTSPYLLRICMQRHRQRACKFCPRLQVVTNITETVYFQLCKYL